ncbi:hypothetical protein [Lactococcus garvieae]
MIAYVFGLVAIYIIIVVTLQKKKRIKQVKAGKSLIDLKPIMLLYGLPLVIGFITFVAFLHFTF